MKTLLSFLLALALSGPLHAGDYEKRTAPMPEGGTLGYRLLLPGPHEGKVPLVLMLHGAGERGDDNAAQLKYGAPLFQKAQDKFPCYVLVPQCPSGQKWADVDWSQPAIEQPPDLSPSMKAVVGVLDALPKEFPDLDLDRIYVTGLSMGGYGTWDLLARFPHRFAAAAPICGGGDVKTRRRACADAGLGFSRRQRSDRARGPHAQSGCCDGKGRRAPALQRVPDGEARLLEHRLR